MAGVGLRLNDTRHVASSFESVCHNRVSKEEGSCVLLFVAHATGDGCASPEVKAIPCGLPLAAVVCPSMPRAFPLSFVIARYCMEYITSPACYDMVTFFRADFGHMFLFSYKLVLAWLFSERQLAIGDWHAFAVVWIPSRDSGSQVPVWLLSYLALSCTV